MPRPYKDNIERATIKNNYYRKVLFTTDQAQLVLMNLRKGVAIGAEIHPKTTQFIRVERGRGVAIIAGKHYRLSDGDALMIPAGTRHDIRATTDDLRLYTIYSPPHHLPHRLNKNRPESG